jgi:glycosyltransferase involved in cell wall biosynthesis
MDAVSGAGGILERDAVGVSLESREEFGPVGRNVTKRCTQHFNISPEYMQCVFLCQVFYPDSQSTSQLLTDLLRAAAGGPLQFTVITGFTSKESGKFPPRRETFDGIEVRRTGIAAEYKKTLIRRGLHYFCYMIGATAELWKVRKHSLVFGVTNPPFTPISLWMLSKCFVGRYQVWLHDIYPDGLIAVGRLQPEGLVARLWRAVNRRALRGAERLVVVGRDMAELVESVYGVPRDKIEYVPHWSSFTPGARARAEETQMFRTLLLDKKFIVQYSGNMGLWHDIESIVLAAHKLRDRQEIRFLMIGDGLRRVKAEQLAVELGLQNMTWLPFQPKESLSDSLACCHLALVSQREGLKGIAVPCKIYGILASGRGVLAQVPSGSEVDLVVNEEACGVTVPPGNADALAGAILELHQDRARVARMGENAFRAYQEKYTLEVAVERFKRIWSSAELAVPMEVRGH